MMIQRDFRKTKGHSRVYSSCAPSQQSLVIGCKHEAARRAKRNEHYMDGHQRSKEIPMKANIYIYISINLNIICKYDT